MKAGLDGLCTRQFGHDAVVLSRGTREGDPGTDGTYSNNFLRAAASGELRQETEVGAHALKPKRICSKVGRTLRRIACNRPTEWSAPWTQISPAG
jgi:hypothetical protein